MQPTKYQYVLHKIMKCKMKKIIKFGEEVEGYSIRVLNERELRAAAGILFLATFTSLMFILLKGNFVPIKYVLTFIAFIFLTAYFIDERFSERP